MSFSPFQYFHYRPHQDLRRDLLRSEEGFEEVTKGIPDEADEKCRKQNECKEKNENIDSVKKDLVLTAQPLEKF